MTAAIVVVAAAVLVLVAGDLIATAARRRRRPGWASETERKEWERACAKRAEDMRNIKGGY